MRFFSNSLCSCCSTEPSISKIGDFQFGKGAGSRLADQIGKKAWKSFWLYPKFASEDGLKMLTLDYVLEREGLVADLLPS